MGLGFFERAVRARLLGDIVHLVRVRGRVRGRGRGTGRSVGLGVGGGVGLGLG